MQLLAKVFSDRRRFEGAKLAKVGQWPLAREARSPPGKLAGWTDVRDLKPVLTRPSASGGRRTGEEPDGDRQRDDPLAHPPRHPRRPRGEPPEDVRGARLPQEDDSPREEIVERFAENVAEYEATVRRVASAELPGAIEEALARRGVKRLVIPLTSRRSGSPRV